MARADGSLLQPGDLFYQPEVRERFRHWLAPKYWLRNADRPPVTVMLPDTSLFLVDGFPNSKGLGSYGEGYDVDGEVPRLTIVQPITDHPSGWKGRLIDGVLEWDG